MNHLAHLFLAGDSVESLIGNLAGDFVKGPLHGRFTEGIRAGIAEHRSIDAFTDAHPAVGAFRRILVPEHGHYARVIADVFFDHFLAFRFEEHAGEPLQAFLSRSFAILDQHTEAMPPRLAHTYPHMRSGEWFRSYADVDGIWRALWHMSRRFSRAPRLEMATHYLITHRAPLEAEFRRFLPDVVGYAKALRSLG